MKNNYTSSLKKKYILFTILSWILCFGTAAVLIITAISGMNKDPTPKTEDALTMEQKFGTLLYSLGISLIIVAILSIIVKDKIEPTVWMVNVILAGYCFNMGAVYIVFGIWFINNYIIKALKNRYKNRALINKEIDKRE